MRQENKTGSDSYRWAVYVLLFAYIGVSLGYQIVSSVSFVSAYFDLRRQVQEPFQLGSEPDDSVASTTSVAERAGLQPGDRLESINGVPYRGLAQWQGTQWHAHAGDVITVRVRRADGTHRFVSIRFEPGSNRVSISEVSFLVFFQIALPVFCLALGYWVTLARPLDPNAWFVILLLSYPEAFISVSTWQWWPGIWLPLRLYWH